jgi:hypothetical protein
VAECVEFSGMFLEEKTPLFDEVITNCLLQGRSKGTFENYSHIVGMSVQFSAAIRLGVFRFLPVRNLIISTLWVDGRHFCVKCKDRCELIKNKFIEFDGRVSEADFLTVKWPVILELANWVCNVENHQLLIQHTHIELVDVALLEDFTKRTLRMIQEIHKEQEAKEEAKEAKEAQDIQDLAFRPGIQYKVQYEVPVRACTELGDVSGSMDFLLGAGTGTGGTVLELKVVSCVTSEHVQQAALYSWMHNGDNRPFYLLSPKTGAVHKYTPRPDIDPAAMPLNFIQRKKRMPISRKRKRDDM